MSADHRFTSVKFERFKAFEEFTLKIRHFNILVGPNNSGKSTVLTAFRILAAGIRKATRRNPECVNVQGKMTPGYSIDMEMISVGEENIFFNYDDSSPASVHFIISNGSSLTLRFPEPGLCYLVANHHKGPATSPSVFRSRFKCSIGFVPILGPVEHNEKLYAEEAARRALFNYRAARNFRNIWHHFPEKFNAFRALLQETWPGMDIEAPQIHTSTDGAVLHMFCPEERIPREIFWAGFGFQVWCQMLTHLVQSAGNSVFLIDEPDIYLHSDLQRQLLGILRGLGPDVIIATHSTEIITESEADDIVLINKKRKHARRIKDPSELAEVFSALGSNLNPILTQLAKTRCAVFVEGKDFQVLGRFARKLGFSRVGTRSTFAVVPVGGFSPERIRSLKDGIEKTLGTSIRSAVVLDRDYRSTGECESVIEACEKFSDLVTVHCCKEIENFLLVPPAIDRAAERRLIDRNRRTGGSVQYTGSADKILSDFADSQKTDVASRHLSLRQRFDRAQAKGTDVATSNKVALEEFEKAWASEKLYLIPGKVAFGAVNHALQESFSVSITHTAIIDAMREEEVPAPMRILIQKLDQFSQRVAR